jgi:hypothetical protein
MEASVNLYDFQRMSKEIYEHSPSFVICGPRNQKTLAIQDNDQLGRAAYAALRSRRCDETQWRNSLSGEILKFLQARNFIQV